MPVTCWCQILLCCGRNSTSFCFCLSFCSFGCFSFLVNLFTVCTDLLILSHLFLIIFHCKWNMDCIIDPSGFILSNSGQLFDHDLFICYHSFVMFFCWVYEVCIWQESHKIFQGPYCICGVFSSPIMALRAGSAAEMDNLLTAY